MTGARPQEPWHVTVQQHYVVAAPERAWRSREDLTKAVLVLVLLALAAPLVGLLWAHVAPKLDIAPLLNNSSVPYRAQVGDDAWFLLLTALAGAATGWVASAVSRGGPGMLLGLAVGGGAAAAVAARVGFLAERGRTLAALRAQGITPRAELLNLVDFKVRALGVAAAWPIAAVAVFVIIVAARDGQR